jgi:ABC-type phosphate transport system substrate-binding protein
MKKYTWSYGIFALLLGLLLHVTALAEDVVVIVNKDNNNPINHALVVKIYTGAARGWADGSPIFALDLEEDSPVREDFYVNVIGKSRAAMRAIWAQNIFTGKGLPPRLANPDTEMKKLVRSNRNAIGYIRASSVDDSIKVVAQ